MHPPSGTTSYRASVRCGHKVESAYATVMYPGVFAVSIRKYVYAVLLLAHTVPLPPTRLVEHE